MPMDPFWVRRVIFFTWCLTFFKSFADSLIFKHCPEVKLKTKELSVLYSGHRTFLTVDLKLLPLVQKALEGGHHFCSGPCRAHIHNTVIGIAAELVPASIKLLVQFVQENVAEQLLTNEQPVFHKEIFKLIDRHLVDAGASLVAAHAFSNLLQGSLPPDHLLHLYGIYEVSFTGCPWHLTRPPASFAFGLHPVLLETGPIQI